MKKVLITNTKYINFGGEDSNIVDEVDLLRKHFKTKYIEFKNSEKLNVLDYISFLTFSNINSNRILSKEIKEFEPDCIYVHNTWFRLSLGIFKIAKKNNIPILLKLHNFRYDCAGNFSAKKHLRGKDFCDKCNFKKSKNQIFNKYFTDSYLRSIFIILFSKRQTKKMKSKNVTLLVMNNFHKNYLVSLGYNASSIEIYLNPINLQKVKTYNPQSNYVLFAGRISNEKGVGSLIDSWLDAEVNNLKLFILGEGEELKSLITQYDKKSNVKFLGIKTHRETIEYIVNARAVVTATKMVEGQPRLLCEASAHGVPSIYPKTGGIDFYFPDNYLLSFEQYNYHDLAKKLKLLENSNELIKYSEQVQTYLEQILEDGKMIEKFTNILEKKL